jgi:hypothetical protein
LVYHGSVEKYRREPLLAVVDFLACCCAAWMAVCVANTDSVEKLSSSLPKIAFASCCFIQEAMPREPREVFPAGLID